MPELIVLIGISGCGKSTLSSRLNAVVVSSDAIRGELYGDENAQMDPARVFAVAHRRVRDSLESGKSVVFDATNVTSFARKSLLDAVRDISCDRTGILFLATPEVAIRRQKFRERKVPEEAIWRQYNNLLRDMKNIQSEFDRLVIV